VDQVKRIAASSGCVSVNSASIVSSTRVVDPADPVGGDEAAAFPVAEQLGVMSSPSSRVLVRLVGVGVAVDGGVVAEHLDCGSCDGRPSSVVVASYAPGIRVSHVSCRRPVACHGGAAAGSWTSDLTATRPNPAYPDYVDGRGARTPAGSGRLRPDISLLTTLDGHTTPPRRGTRAARRGHHAELSATGNAAASSPPTGRRVNTAASTRRSRPSSRHATGRSRDPPYLITLGPH